MLTFLFRLNQNFMNFFILAKTNLTSICRRTPLVHSSFATVADDRAPTLNMPIEPAGSVVCIGRHRVPMRKSQDPRVQPLLLQIGGVYRTI